MQLFEGLPPEVKSLSIVTFFISVGFGVQAPALPVFASQLGAGSAAVGAMVAAFALVRLLSAWPIGRAINLIGERRTLSTGMALLAMTSIAAGFSQAAWQLILFRGLGGLGSAAFSVSAMSLLLRKSPPEARGRAVGIFMGSLNVGLVAGPAIGGALMLLSPRAVFFIYGAVVAATGAIALRVMSHDHEPAAAKAASRKPGLSVAAALRSSAYRAAVAANFSQGWIVYGMRASVLPLLVINLLHAPSHWIGVGLAMCALLQVVTLPGAGKLSDTFGRKRPLMAGSALLATSLLLLEAWPSLATYLICLAMMGVGAALCTTSASATVGDVTGGRGGTVVALYQMSSDLGLITGPLIAGALAETSFSLALSVSALVGILSVATASAMAKSAAPAAVSAEPVKDVAA